MRDPSGPPLIVIRSSMHFLRLLSDSPIGSASGKGSRSQIGLLSLYEGRIIEFLAPPRTSFHIAVIPNEVTHGLRFENGRVASRLNRHWIAGLQALVPAQSREASSSILVQSGQSTPAQPEPTWDRAPSRCCTAPRCTDSSGNSPTR